MDLSVCSRKIPCTCQITCHRPRCLDPSTHSLGRPGVAMDWGRPLKAGHLSLLAWGSFDGSGPEPRAQLTAINRRQMKGIKRQKENQTGCH
jgi:hypothetical protein